MDEGTIFFAIYFGAILLSGLVIALVPVLKSQPKTPQEEQEYEIAKDATP